MSVIANYSPSEHRGAYKCLLWCDPFSKTKKIIKALHIGTKNRHVNLSYCPDSVTNISMQQTEKNKHLLWKFINIKQGCTHSWGGRPYLFTKLWRYNIQLYFGLLRKSKTKRRTNIFILQDIQTISVHDGAITLFIIFLGAGILWICSHIAAKVLTDLSFLLAPKFHHSYSWIVHH